MGRIGPGTRIEGTWGGMADASDRLNRILAESGQLSGELGFSALTNRIGDAAGEASYDELKVTVIGRLSTGLSTLVNALLAPVEHPVDLSGHKGPMAM